jgi:hypothetical protein
METPRRCEHRAANTKGDTSGFDESEYSMVKPYCVKQCGRFCFRERVFARGSGCGRRATAQADMPLQFEWRASAASLSQARISMTKKEWAIIGILGVMVVCVFALLALVVLNSFVVPSQTAPTTKSQELITVVPSQTAPTTKSQELIRAEQLLPANTPHRDIVLDEVRKGYLPALDIELYLYMQERWDYYEKLDGKYIISKHDPLVSRDAQNRYNLSKEEIDRRYDKVAKLLAGIRP